MSTTSSDILLYDKKDRIVVMTINRPEKLNTLTPELLELLAQSWERFEADEDAWVAILTGAGDQAFCAGADMGDTTSGAAIAEEKIPRIFSLQPWKPMIAAINGYAIGGGWMLAQKCDVRIAAEHAELGISEARFNLLPAFVGDLTRQLHLGHALEIALWGDRRITAQRGYEIGWINSVVSKEKLMDEAMSWASRMLYLGPRSVQKIKRLIYEGFYMHPSITLPFAFAFLANLANMEDSIEGIKAFVEKRKPQFKNK
jgi:enoyl-CoA hydratase/carnithine racemase